ncbi:hypothetical protein, partial [Acidiphilium sp.]|uniref:hypothetical protein n=1 Tax=Acidiphilium sp. TaxID=527 RepID=UPI003D044688
NLWRRSSLILFGMRLPDGTRDSPSSYFITELLKNRHQAIKPRVDHNKINHRCIHAPRPSGVIEIA